MEPGTKLGHYEILAALGEGGMGQVYRARDTTLDRDVAIKVLPEDFASDAGRLARFEREAKLLASLNHPNIATIFGFEESDGVRFIAMELVEGQSLAERIAASGHIEIDEALEIARRIALALEAAHEAGVIHRDLKPANVQVAPDGTVKVLDFGLAKVHEPSGSADLSDSPTAMMPTATGVIMGTAPYMSPEQARGTRVDRRCDIWAFGCVLYEMVVGERAFGGKTVSDTMATILKEDPDWKLLPPQTPKSVTTLLNRCLTKDARNRLHHIGDARLELSDASSEGIEGTGHVGLQPREALSRRFALIGLTGLAVGVFGTVAIGAWVGSRASPGASTAPTSRFSIRLEAEAPLALGRGLPLGFDLPLFAVSPDGKRLVYVNDPVDRRQLYVIEVGTFDAVPLVGTEDAYGPVFSPDGDWVAFFVGNKLMKAPVTGGRAESLADVAGGVWGTAWQGETIYVTTHLGSVIQSVPDTGGALADVARLDEVDGVEFAAALSPLPNAGGLLVSTTRHVPVSADYRDIHWWSPETNEWRLILPAAGYAPRYSRSGHLVYARAGGLRAARFDLQTLEIVGEAVPVLGEVRVDSQFGYGQYALAENGSLFYARGGDIGVGVPTWVDRQGNAEPLPMPAAHYGMFSLAPEGDRLAIQVGGATDQVWIYDLTSNSGTRLTTSGNNGWPVWSPDGQRVTYSAREDDRWALYTRQADGTGEAELLYAAAGMLLPWSQSPAEEIVSIGLSSKVPQQTLFISLDGTPTLTTHGLQGEWGYQFSPDGQWVVYGSARDGPYEVFVSPYPELDREFKVSDGGGTEPMWSKQNDQILYHDGSQWIASDVSFDDGFTSSPPRNLVNMTSRDTGASGTGVLGDGNPPKVRVEFAWVRSCCDRARERSGRLPIRQLQSERNRAGPGRRRRGDSRDRQRNDQSEPSVAFRLP